VVLPRLTAAGSPLRVGTLSWNLRRHEEPEQTVEDFLASFDGCLPESQRMRRACFIRETAAACPTPEEVLNASGGVPVVFEAVTDEGNLLLVRGVLP